MTDRKLCKESCSYCGKPVYADEGFHGLSLDHYDCYAKNLSRLNELNLSISGANRSGDRRKREGEGETAKKVIAMAQAAIEDVLGEKIYDIRIWNQKGAYRGPKWDLARWGLYFSIQNTPLRGSAHSWSTMTSCAKAKKLIAHQEDGPYQFNIEP